MWNKRQIDDELALFSEERKLASDVAGTDICVKGGHFACSCNRCREEMHEFMKITSDIFSWPQEEAQALYKIARIFSEKYGDSQGLYIRTLYQEYKKEGLPELLNIVRRKVIEEWYSVPWFKRLFKETPEYVTRSTTEATSLLPEIGAPTPKPL